MQFAFGDHLLDVEQCELRRRGARVAIEPQVFHLLLYLIQNRHRVVSKSDLIEHVWHGRVVSDSAMMTRISSARTAVGDNGAAQGVIRTLSRRGFRFVAEVTEHGTLPLDARDPLSPGLALADKPSIAVLPFDNMSGDPAQEYFADGVVEEITNALSRIRWLFVIARNSAFTYKGQATDVRQIGRELGVRYVLEGSIRKIGNRVRITAQLIETTNGTHLWADRFDGFLEDVFDLQDRVAISVAGVIEPTLMTAESRLARQRPTSDLTAYDLYLRALPLFYSFSREGIANALRLFEQAIERDPSYGAALGMAAICHERFRQDGWSADPEADRQQGIILARRALEASPGDPVVLANAAFVLSFSEQDIGGVMAIMDRALTLNPSYARGWYLSAIIWNIAGEAEDAVRRAKQAMLLSPRERSGPFLIALGFAYLYSREFDAAIETLVSIIQEYPSFPETYRALASAYALSGRLDEARATVERLRAITPAIWPRYVSSIRREEHRALYLGGLRLAMGAEDAPEVEA